MKVRLLGITPRKAPCEPEDGWFHLPVRENPDIRTVLDWFGLSFSGMTVLRNGRHAQVDDTVGDADELQIFLKSLGG